MNSFLTTATEFPPLPEGLPSNYASALLALREALTSPALPPDQCPLLKGAPIQAGRGGRPSGVQPSQVVRLVRFVKSGAPIAEAARRARLTERTARRVLAGESQVAHHPAVVAAGVLLPKPPPHPQRRNPGETTKTAPGATNAAGLGVDSQPAPCAPQNPAPAGLPETTPDQPA